MRFLSLIVSYIVQSGTFLFRFMLTMNLLFLERARCLMDVNGSVKLRQNHYCNVITESRSQVADAVRFLKDYEPFEHMGWPSLNSPVKMLLEQDRCLVFHSIGCNVLAFIPAQASSK